MLSGQALVLGTHTTPYLENRSIATRSNDKKSSSPIMKSLIMITGFSSTNGHIVDILCPF